SLFPITVGLSTLMNQGASQPALYTTVITGALVSIIPLIALFLLLQRYWQSDLTGGAVKGRDGPDPGGRRYWTAEPRPVDGASRRPTISDVARRAGVSTGTVSRYLNGGRWVSAESSKAVTRAIRETGYVANSTARRLRTGRSGTVAFLVDEPPARFFEDPNFES